MKGFVTIAGTTYQMIEVSTKEMDELLKKGGDSQVWPFRFDRRKRVYPVPREQDVVFYRDEGKLK